MKSEKGDFLPSSIKFDDDSVFGVVENLFMPESKYFICDDLSNEWTDHIGLFDNKIAFYLSKYNTTTYSATSFQDIVGQALKNLGNIDANEMLINEKRSKWAGVYTSNEKNNNCQTQIQKIRNGGNN